MKKILIIITTAFVEYGGLTTVVMNYLRFMNKNGLRIDVASTNSASQKLVDEIKAMEGQYYFLGKRKKIATYCINLNKLLKMQKIPVRIAHVHSSRSKFSLLNKVLSPIFKSLYTNTIAVSKLSDDWLYGENQYVILNNAIDLEKYAFNEDVRTELKKTWKLTNKRVIGTVRKLNSPKN